MHTERENERGQTSSRWPLETAEKRGVQPFLLRQLTSAPTYIYIHTYTHTHTHISRYSTYSRTHATHATSSTYSTLYVCIYIYIYCSRSWATVDIRTVFYELSRNVQISAARRQVQWRGTCGDYIDICMYVHTCCVLINPPIPYITSSPLCLLRVFTSYLNLGSWEGGQWGTLVKPLDLICFFIYDANYFINLGSWEGVYKMA